MSLLHDLLGPEASALATEPALADIARHFEQLLAPHVAGAAATVDIAAAALSGNGDDFVAAWMMLTLLPEGVAAPCVHEANGGAGQAFFRFDLAGIRERLPLH